METILDFAAAGSTAPARDMPGRWPFREQIFGELDPVADPIVVIGGGPAGRRAVHELMQRAPDRHIIWYGAERGAPYDRVQLTSLVAGEVDLKTVTDDYRAASYNNVERRFGCAVKQIDRGARLVIDQRHRFQAYSTLILATGSTARIPENIDTRLPGVFPLRRLKDAKALAERREHSCCTVVLGGGMLGLEAARAMQSTRTKVIVIERSERLLPQQLDAGAARLLKEYLEARGISILLNSQVEQIYGRDQLQGLLLADRALPCDTLIVATGADPNVELARMAGLRINRGIEIDDRTLTSDPHIHAIGECAEHRGTTYRSVGPGLEQARVAAAITTGTMARYTGSIPVARLKVIDLPVFSIGSELDSLPSAQVRAWTYRSTDGHSQVRLLTRDGRVVGASAFGHATDMDHLQQAVTEQLRLRPWHLLRFWLTGRVLPASTAAPATPDTSAAVTANGPYIPACASERLDPDWSGAECLGTDVSGLDSNRTDWDGAAPMAAAETAAADDADGSESKFTPNLPAVIPQLQQRVGKPAPWSMIAATTWLDLSASSGAYAREA